jgi:hypothetical protein
VNPSARVVPAAASWLLRFAFPLAPYPCDVLRSTAGRAEGVVWRDRERVLRNGVTILAGEVVAATVVVLSGSDVARGKKKRERGREVDIYFTFQTRH